MPCASRFGARCSPVRSLLSKQPERQQELKINVRVCNTKER
jgi:hypothetical protein